MLILLKHPEFLKALTLKKMKSFYSDTMQETKDKNHSTLQEQVCDLCDNPSFQVFSQKGRHNSSITTVICKGCGLVYTNPRLTDQETSAYYQNAYWKQYKKQQEPNEKFFQRRLPKIKPLLEELRPFLKSGMKVLECGCSVGALLSSIREIVGPSGRVIGVEPSQKQSQFARDMKGLEVLTGLIQEVQEKLESNFFDVIVMNHVLEHTTSPSQILALIKNLLKHNGVFILEVPNIEAPGSRLSHFFHIAHHFAFSPETLRYLALKTKFSVLRIAALDGDLPKTRLFAVLKKTTSEDNAFPLESIRDDYEKRATALNQYERRYWLTGASIRKKFTHWIRHKKYSS